MSLVLPHHPTCQQIVEAVTTYSEGMLEPEERDRFELHLTSCAACVTYYRQMIDTKRAAAAVRDEPVQDTTREALVAAFRAWKEGRRP